MKCEFLKGMFLILKISVCKEQIWLMQRQGGKYELTKSLAVISFVKVSQIIKNSKINK